MSADPDEAFENWLRDKSSQFLSQTAMDYLLPKINLSRAQLEIVGKFLRFPSCPLGLQLLAADEVSIDGVTNLGSEPCYPGELGTIYLRLSLKPSQNLDSLHGRLQEVLAYLGLEPKNLSPLVDSFLAYDLKEEALFRYKENNVLANLYVLPGGA